MRKTKKKETVISDKKYQWDLSLLYSSPADPKIEEGIAKLERAARTFARTYDVADKTYLHDNQALLAALRAYEKLEESSVPSFMMYLYFLRDIEAGNVAAESKISLMEGRMAHIENMLAFFRIHLGTVSKEGQREFLSDKHLSHFNVFLSRIFDDARHTLSVPEEKIMNFKSIPAYNMWVSGNERVLNQKTVSWSKKSIPLAQALGMASQLSTSKERAKLARAIAQTLKTVAPFSEAEMNAVVTDKKISDGLRRYETPYESTVRDYRNDPVTVERLVDTVTGHFHIAHRFYRTKARLLRQKRLLYSDRAATVGKVQVEFTFDSAAAILEKTFDSLDPKYADIFRGLISERRVDVYPRVGKRSGAYCWGAYGMPTFVLLNHTDNLRSFTTAAHEMGHAFHTHLSQSQGALYCGYSTALAETASTLFEAIALDAIYDTLSDKEKIIVLHDKINDDIATVFRQIACFNYEKDIHATIRSKGYASQEELADLHNKHMSSYLGPLFKLERDDGYFFVGWSHIRRFFYVYSYAYGLLVSKALLRRYRKDPSFWKKIEQFLSAGGKDSPERILKEIGIDVSKPDFWKEGLKEIEDDIIKLEKLTKK